MRQTAARRTLQQGGLAQGEAVAAWASTSMESAADRGSHEMLRSCPSQYSLSSKHGADSEAGTEAR